jgi:hypothetical protein
MQTSATAELYDPRTGSFSLANLMGANRCGHSATLLPDGRVLIAGGIDDAQPTVRISSAELYEPKTGKFRSTGSLTTAWAGGQAATLLPDGSVLIVGGSEGSATAELFS